MKVNEYLESTLLRPDATMQEITALCDEAAENRFCAVVVNPVFVKRCKERLCGTGVRVGTVIDFPFGAGTPEQKIALARLAIEDGADETDVVGGLGYLKSGDWAAYAETMRNLREATRGTTLKIILETSELKEEEIMKATAVCTAVDADFVKTSTGYSSRGASVQDIRLMKLATEEAAKAYGVSPCGIKASGGIKTLADAKTFIEAGAIRIGTSRASAIASESRQEEGNEE